MLHCKYHPSSITDFLFITLRNVLSCGASILRLPYIQGTCRQKKIMYDKIKILKEITGRCRKTGNGNDPNLWTGDGLLLK